MSRDPAIETTLHLVRETKNAFRYEASEGEPIIGAVYLRKEHIGDVGPARIIVTVDPNGKSEEES